MKLRISVPVATRPALACCLLSWLGSTTLVAWSIERAADQAGQLAGLQRERQLSEQHLAEHRSQAAALDRAMLLLEGIRPLAADETLGGHQQGDEHWREYPINLDSVLLHEEAALERLAAWQSRSPVQHQIRACSMERDRDGQAIHLSCRLAALALIR